MNKSNFDDGYSIATVLVIISMISFALSSVLVAYSFYNKRIERKLYEVTESKDLFAILDKVKDELTEGDEDDPVSQYSGWFSELPDVIDGYEIKYQIEDCRIDINHINAELLAKAIEDVDKKLFQSKADTTSDKVETERKDQTGDKVKLPEYFYSKQELIDILKDETSDVFSMYMVPNLNTADLDKMKLFFESYRYDENVVKKIETSVKNYRSRSAKKDKYLEYNKLLIDDTRYTTIRNSDFDRKKLDDIYFLLDYKGRINLNFVTEKVFLIGSILCGTKKNQATRQWDKVKNMQESEKEITKLNEVFGNNKKYDKMFSVNSKMFNVEITGEKKQLSALIRRYKIRDTEVKVLKLNINDVAK